MTVADQRATQKLLQAALGVLKGFYEKKAAAAALVQKQEPAGPPPPPGFKEYKNNAASGGVMLELEQLSNYKAQLHSSCDFVMKNFEIRQTARDEEVEALRQAKAILSGAKFEAFLQDA